MHLPGRASDQERPAVTQRGAAGDGSASAAAAPHRGGSPFVRAALRYAARGWPVFPLRPRGKEPLTEHGVKDATCDTATIVAWWRRWPDANVGIATGAPSGLVVLDVDEPKGGAHTLAVLEAGHAPALITLEAETGAGCHLYFRADQAARFGCSAKHLQDRYGPGLDLRGTGGYMVAPPSLHPSGRHYRWCQGSRLAELPTWLEAELLHKSEPPRSAPRREQVVTAVPSNPDTFGAYWRTILNGWLVDLSRAPQGTRNDTLNRASYRLGQVVAIGAPEELIGEFLTKAGLAIGLTPAEVTRTVRSGLEGGRREPDQRFRGGRRTA